MELPSTTDSNLVKQESDALTSVNTPYIATEKRVDMDEQLSERDSNGNNSEEDDEVDESNDKFGATLNEKRKGDPLLSKPSHNSSAYSVIKHAKSSNIGGANNEQSKEQADANQKSGKKEEEDLTKYLHIEGYDDNENMWEEILDFNDYDKIDPGIMTGNTGNSHKAADNANSK